MRDLDLASWQALLALPRRAQPAAVESWLSALSDEPVNEAWNARFGTGSLFDAWTRSTVMDGVYSANAAALRARMDDAGPGWRMVEIGVGDGRLWRRVLTPADRGTLVLVDPMPEALQAAAYRLPNGITLETVAAPVQDTLEAPFWRDLDAVVCSLTLHHLAGTDAAERRRHGLTGPGKLEVLRRMAGALADAGMVLLNEADIHCDVQLPAGDLLAERLLDSYVRRCAGSLLRDVVDRDDADDDLRARWRSIVRHWCLEQVRMAAVPLPERDVYELDVGRWMALLEQAGLRVVERGFTDDVGLFCRYRAERA